MKKIAVFLMIIPFLLSSCSTKNVTNNETYLGVINDGGEYKKKYKLEKQAITEYYFMPMHGMAFSCPGDDKFVLLMDGLLGIGILSDLLATVLDIGDPSKCYRNTFTTEKKPKGSNLHS